MHCLNCNKNLSECQEHCMGTNVICNECNICKICAKKIYNYEKKCDTCCHVCKRCDKILINNNWPIDIIINDVCEKCSRLCTNCEKYTSVNKAIYDDSKEIFCEKCFCEKFKPFDENYKFTPVCKKENLGRLLLRWKKTHVCIICSDSNCNKQFWKYINSKNDLCNKCSKKQNKKETSIDPSNGDLKYSQKGIDGEIKWVLTHKRKKCFNCYSSIWLKLENLTNQDKYLCDSCKPNSSTKRYKYNKENQNWIVYRMLIKCGKCEKEKWTFININNAKNVKYCKKCIMAK